MGAIVSRMAIKAFQKWAYESTKHINAEKMLKNSVEAADTVNGNNFNTVVSQVCQTNGVATPAANVIADYRIAVSKLATCINAFTKTERNQLKTAWGKLVASKNITPAEKDACALPIGRAMHWGTHRTTIETNFDSNILTPLAALLQSLGLTGSMRQAVGLVLRHGELGYPLSVATYIYMILT